MICRSDQDRAAALGSVELEVLGQDVFVELAAHRVGRGLARLGHCGVLVVLVGRNLPAVNS